MTANIPPQAFTFDFPEGTDNIRKPNPLPLDKLDNVYHRDQLMLLQLIGEPNASPLGTAKDVFDLLRKNSDTPRIKKLVNFLGINNPATNERPREDALVFWIKPNDDRDELTSLSTSYRGIVEGISTHFQLPDEYSDRLADTKAIVADLQLPDGGRASTVRMRRSATAGLLGLSFHHSTSSGAMSVREWVKQIEAHIGFKNLDALRTPVLEFAFVVIPVEKVVPSVVALQEAIESESPTSPTDTHPFGIRLQGATLQDAYYLVAASPLWRVRGASGANVPCNSPGSLPRLLPENNKDLERLHSVMKKRWKAASSFSTSPTSPKVRVYVLDSVFSDEVRLEEEVLRGHYPWWFKAEGGHDAPFKEIKIQEAKPPRGRPTNSQDLVIAHNGDFLEVSRVELEDFCNATPPLMDRLERTIDLSNHGPFVIDVLCREIPEKYSPSVKIRLVEIINKRGSGDFDILLRGLRWVLEDIRRSKDDYFVINLSCAVSVADIFGNDSLPIPQNQRNQKQREVFKQNVLTAVQMLDNLFKVIEQAKPGKVKIFAAAGNDAQDSGGDEVQAWCERVDDSANHHEITTAIHQMAALPAIAPSVVGVAAVDNDGHLTSYTNEADSPLILKLYGEPLSEKIGGNGAQAFGGEIDWNDWKQLWCKYSVRKEKLKVEDKFILIPYAENGVIGPYLGPIHNRDGTSEGGLARENNFKWVEWSGTSFAAPKVAGQFVAHLLEHNSIEKAEKDLLHHI